MLIHEIVEYCNAEYRDVDTTHVCQDCNHLSKCSESCKNCLEQVHYPSRYPNGKKKPAKAFLERPSCFFIDSLDILTIL